MGTEGVGICHDGTETCMNGTWSTTCAGEQLPEAMENCGDNLDHNCNALPGCLDFSCILSMACMNGCTSSNVDPGCVCPMGSGDQALCPEGYIGKTPGGGMSCLTDANCPSGQKCILFTCSSGGSSLTSTECCPCTTNDCGNAGCCAESVCAGNSQCAGLTCNPLPASCNGMVNADCDDFTEDCDEPCCKCTMCP
jgi:hypothetical protein